MLYCLTEKEDEQINQITKDMMIFWMKMTSVQVKSIYFSNKHWRSEAKSEFYSIILEYMAESF